MTKTLTQGEKDEICKRCNVRIGDLEKLIKECTESNDLEACVEKKIAEAEAKNKAEENIKLAEELEKNKKAFDINARNNDQSKPKGTSNYPLFCVNFPENPFFA